MAKCVPGLCEREEFQADIRRLNGELFTAQDTSRRLVGIIASQKKKIEAISIELRVRGAEHPVEVAHQVVCTMDDLRAENIQLKKEVDNHFPCIRLMVRSIDEDTA